LEQGVPDSNFIVFPFVHLSFFMITFISHMPSTRGEAMDCCLSEVQQQDRVLSLGFVIPPCPSSCLLEFADLT
jgi:hypothetical protein